MAKFQGVLGTQVAVTGATSITIDDRILQASNRTLWDKGVFGLSVTQVGTQNFNVYIVGVLQGVTVPIAGISGIGSTTATLIPIVNQATLGVQAGTTQNAIVGIPTPRRIVFGNSALAGQTYSAVISAMLYSSD